MERRSTKALHAMTQLTGYKCRAHTRHEAHSSVCERALALLSEANVLLPGAVVSLMASRPGFEWTPER